LKRQTAAYGPWTLPLAYTGGGGLKMKIMTVTKLSVAFGVFACVALCQTQPLLIVQGVHGTHAELSLADLSHLPQQTIQTTDHGTTVTFEGVRLADVLAKVDLPLGESFHKTAASYYLSVEAGDGYRAVFAWAELDPSFMDKAVYVATRRDGKPLPGKDGPFQLVAPGEKRGARWVRQVHLLRVEPLPESSAYDSEQARWISANLPEMQHIQAGMTRKELLRVFMEEGGLSTRTHRRYAYRRCGLIKVDVEFAPTGDPGSGEQQPGDLIVKISKPFLELGIVD
jgi:hypothetical protein